MFKSITVVLLIAVVVLGIFLFTGNSSEEIFIEDNLISDAEIVGGAEIAPEVEEDQEELETSPSAEGFQHEGEKLAGNNSPLIDFNEADYQSALESDKTVFLYFYAKWCPTCKREIRDALVPAFDAYEGDEFVGFRVNYNDRDTSDLEESLAAEFGVVYQHTKVFIKNGEVVATFPNSWTEQEYLTNFESYK